MTLSSEPRKRREYIAVSAASFLNAVGSNLQLSVWPFFLQLSKVSESAYGFFGTISSIAGIVTRAVGAKLSTRGESLTLVVGTLAATCAMLTYALAPAPATVLIGMTLASISVALVMMGRTLLIRTVTSTERRATSYGVVGTLGNAGTVLATNLGMIMFSVSDYTGLFLLGASITFLALLTTLALPRRKVGALRGSFLPLSSLRKASPALQRFYLVTALDSLFWAIPMPFFTITPVVLFSATKEQIAMLQTLMWGTAIATNVITTSISDRLHSRKAMLAFSELLGVMCFAVYSLAQSVPPLYVCAVLFGLVTVTWGPIVSAYITEITNHSNIHEAVGTWMTVTALARIPGPFIGGFFAEVWHPKAPYVIALSVVAILAVIIQVMVIEPKRT